MSFVFVSYPQSRRSEVEALVAKIEDQGLGVFWDKQLEPGKWEEQLVKKLNEAAALIVIIDDEVVRRGSGSYVFREVKIAVDQDYEMILPIELGDINLGGDIAPLIKKFQIFRTKTMIDLLSSAEFQGHLERIRDYIEAGGRDAWFNKVEAKDATAAGWPVLGDNLLERQALALSVAMFEGELPFLVSDAVSGIQARLSEGLRRETREEREARPRAFVDRSFSDQLDSVNAERIRVSAGYHQQQDIVRFKDPNQRRRLLEYIWREQPQVRRILVTWLDDLIGRDLSDGIHRRIGGGLAHLAQVDLHGMHYEFMAGWLAMDPAVLEDNPEARNRKAKELRMASEMLASAYNVPANRTTVASILNNLARGETMAAGPMTWAWQAAVIIALGPLGQRAPKLAVALLKDIGKHIKVGRGWNEALRRELLSTPLVRGEERRVLEGEESFDIEEGALDEVARDRSDEATRAELDADVTVGSDDKAFGESQGDAGETSKPEASDDPEEELEDGESSSLSLASKEAEEGGESRGLPAASFLQEMATWIDEKIASGNDAKKKLYERQIAIWVFLSVFERMPVYRKSAPNRLTLQELVEEIGVREPELLQKIVDAFVRAARAGAQESSIYRPYLHVQVVCKVFSLVRKQSKDRISDTSCPYLQFARRLYAAIDEVDPGRSHFVTRGSGRYLSTAEIDFIEGKVDALQEKELS